MPIHTYKNLIVWQKSIELVSAIYALTQKFPIQEQYGLIAQMRDAAVSIPSNIAEGRRRGTLKDYLRFLRYAYGSGAELETQMIIAKKLFPVSADDCVLADQLLLEVMKMLNAMLKTLKPSPLRS